ncbi:hypothetical protein ACA910_015943 [Epithemia clementina (nom. ined.)]
MTVGQYNRHNQRRTLSSGATLSFTNNKTTSTMVMMLFLSWFLLFKLTSAFGVVKAPSDKKASPASASSTAFDAKKKLTMDLEYPNTRRDPRNLVHPWKVPTWTSSASSTTNQESLQLFPPILQTRSSTMVEPATAFHHPGQHTATSSIPQEFLCGMPWKTSIDPNYRLHKNDSLFYMPFWEYELQFMQRHLTNLRVVPVQSAVTGHDLSYRTSLDQSMRMHTLVLQSDEFRRIRLTVMDAGARTQVFTSVWYPDPNHYATPVLGVDLLQFGERKHLCIMDLQPLHDKNSNSNDKKSNNNNNNNKCEYEHLLEPIRARYPSLQGSMSGRFYDHTQFFSSQMLLGRHDGDDRQGAHEMVYDHFFPAFEEYLKTYLNLHKQTTTNHNSNDNVETTNSQQEAAINFERQRAYDTYSAARDPAHAMLAKSFGTEFADDYVYNVLFPLSTPPPPRPSSPPSSPLSSACSP